MLRSVVFLHLRLPRSSAPAFQVSPPPQSQTMHFFVPLSQWGLHHDLASSALTTVHGIMVVVLCLHPPVKTQSMQPALLLVEYPPPS